MLKKILPGLVLTFLGACDKEAVVAPASPVLEQEVNVPINRENFLNLITLYNYGTEAEGSTLVELKANTEIACKELVDRLSSVGRANRTDSCSTGATISNNGRLSTCAGRFRISVNGTNFPVVNFVGKDRQEVMMRAGEAIYKSGGESSIYMSSLGGGLFDSGRDLFCVEENGRIARENLSVSGALHLFTESPEADRYKGAPHMTPEQKVSELGGEFIKCTSFTQGGRGYLYYDESDNSRRLMTSSPDYKAGMYPVSISYVSPKDMPADDLVEVVDTWAFQPNQSRGIYRQVLAIHLQASRPYGGVWVKSQNLEPVSSHPQLLALLENAKFDCRPAFDGN